MVYWSLLVNFWLLPVPALHGSETQYLSGSVPGSVCPVFKGIKYIHCFWLNIYLFCLYVLIRFISIYMCWCQFHTHATCHAASYASCCLQICLQSLDPPALPAVSLLHWALDPPPCEYDKPQPGTPQSMRRPWPQHPTKAPEGRAAPAQSAQRRQYWNSGRIWNSWDSVEMFETKFWTQQHGYWLGIGW